MPAVRVSSPIKNFNMVNIDHVEETNMFDQDNIVVELKNEANGPFGKYKKSPAKTSNKIQSSVERLPQTSRKAAQTPGQ